MKRRSAPPHGPLGSGKDFTFTLLVMLYLINTLNSCILSCCDKFVSFWCGTTCVVHPVYGLARMWPELPVAPYGLGSIVE